MPLQLKDEDVQRCDIGLIIKDNMTLLMQLFDEELKEYNMQMMTSKCLNTAVMMFYMYLGEHALKHTSYCDVPNVLERVKNNPSLSFSMLSQCKKELLDPYNQTRKLFYVMITNGNVKRANDSFQTQSFPGHVIVLEKYHNPGNLPSFNVYQSYIRSYKLQDHFVMNNKSLEYTFYSIVEFMNDLEEFFEKGIWDEHTSKFWKKFTHVDESTFEGCHFKDVVHFCYKSVQVSHCAKVLKDKIQQKKQVIEENPGSFKVNISFVDARDGDVPLEYETLKVQLDNMINALNA